MPRSRSREDSSLYGMIEPEPVEEDLVRIASIVEKPSPEESPSTLAAIGRYVFTPEIFDALRETPPGHGGEVQLTDAINLLAQDQAVYALTFEGRFDVGSKLDYLRATVEAGARSRRPRSGLQGVPRRAGASRALGLTSIRLLRLDCPHVGTTPRPRPRLGRGVALGRGRAAAVLDRVQALAPLRLPLTDAYGCVVAEDVVATGDLPEFASSAMDGFAVRVRRRRRDPRRAARAGDRRTCGDRPRAGGHGRRRRGDVDRDAPIPGGADAIVPIENAAVEEDEQRVRLLDGPAAGTHVRPQGEDVRQDDVLVAAGKRLGAPELGLLAISGHPTPLVHPRPRVVVLSTGDELIAHRLTVVRPGPTRTRTRSSARSARMGAMPVLAGIVRDDVDSLRETIFSFEIQADAFVSSGGISVGERDVEGGVLPSRGRRLLQGGDAAGHAPGIRARRGKPYFGLPGNPVSVFVSLEVFVRPAILKMMGRRHLLRPEITATLTEDVRGPRGKLQFARGGARRTSDGWTATPTGARGSNLISTVAKANGPRWSRPARRSPKPVRAFA